MIERLAFDGDAVYNAIEASSHLARYAIARPFCQGRRVLDIACGQGYGSYFMKQHWGAASVEGVDVAGDAVAAARGMFSGEGIRYHCHAAERIDELFEPAGFDLIVCLETIEHVDDAQVLLETLHRHLRPGGSVIVSCPNDYWYYPTDEQGNPFHTRKFRFDEFRALAEQVLGPAAMFMYGTPVSGFANLPIEDRRLHPGGDVRGPIAIQHGTRLEDIEMLPTDERVDQRNCSYFVGVWTADAEAVREATVIFPCSMNASAPASGHENVTHLQAEVISARTELFETRANLAWMTGRARKYEDLVTRHQEEERSRQAEAEARQAEAEARLAAEQARLEEQRVRLEEQQARRKEQSEDGEGTHEMRVLGLRAAGFHHENEFLKAELRTAQYEMKKLEQEAQLVRQEIDQLRTDRHRMAEGDDLQRALLEAQESLAAVRRELHEERSAREVQTAEVADWQRRIENMDRVKRFIPGWARGGLKRILHWK